MGKRKTSALDDLGKVFVVVPWWVGPIFIVAVYGLLRYVIPVVLLSALPAGTNPTSAAMNKTFVQILGPLPAKLAPWGAGLVLFVWVASLVQKWNRRGLLDRTQELDNVRALSWHDFELLVGEYYRRRGFMVEERGGASPGGGIDIVLRKDGRMLLV
jgi:restriction system protein